MYIKSMSNSISINGIEIAATFCAGLVSLSFAKDGKIVKTCDSNEASKFVRPENLAKVTSLVALVKGSDEAKAYWAQVKADNDAHEAEYQARTGNYEAHKANMSRAMAI